VRRRYEPPDGPATLAIGHRIDRYETIGDANVRDEPTVELHAGDPLVRDELGGDGPASVGWIGRWPHKNL
jgi:hypothetical protein